MISCDVGKCVGCRTCEVSCSTFHAGAVSPALSRIRVAKLEEIGIDMAIGCLGCFEKYCLACPNEALSVGNRGQIVVDLTLCSGCEVCAEGCPIGAVGFWDGRPLFCDLCGGETSCVKACPAGALSFVEIGDRISLSGFREVEGTPGQRRAAYALAQGEPVRERWKQGARIQP